MTPHDRTFEIHRPRLLALAYRLLGTRADAEDTVQDAWLRWHESVPRVVGGFTATCAARAAASPRRRPELQR